MRILPTTLEAWLAYIESLHESTMALGLERFNQVLSQLNLGTKAKIFTVAGTNGKGSTCAYLESILLAGHYRVGCYSSPHLVSFHERIRVNGAPVDDETLLQAFQTVEKARGDVALTFFEFATLAAWVIFCQHSLDALILEVGLGGRLDAVNAFEPDCAILTSIGMDHMDYLGDTLDAIGVEKASIFRPHKPAVMGTQHLPDSVKAMVEERAVEAYIFNQNFGIETTPTLENRQWGWWAHLRDGRKVERHALPLPGIAGTCQIQNAATALMALECLKADFPLTLSAIKSGLLATRLPGRFQQLSLRPSVIVDVAHNPQAAEVLADTLSQLGHSAKTVAVFGLLDDKDLSGVVSKMKGQIDQWIVTALPSPRSTKADCLAAEIARQGGSVIGSFENPQLAWQAAIEQISDNDRIIVFGSFVLAGWLLGLPELGLEAVSRSALKPASSRGSRPQEQPIRLRMLTKDTHE